MMRMYCLCSLVIFALVFYGRIGAGEVLRTFPIPDEKEKSRFGTVLCTNAEANRIVVGVDIQSNFKGGAYVIDLREEDLYSDDTSILPWTFLLPHDAVEASKFQRGRYRPREKGSAFAFSCAMTYDGNNIAFTAPGHDLAKGMVFSYRYNATGWHPIDRLTLPSIRRGDSFGYRVASSNDGKTIIVTSKVRNFNQGEAYVFQCEQPFQGCELEATLTCPDVISYRSKDGMRISANFGVSVAMNGNGDRLVIGATGFQVEEGAAYVFERINAKWINTTRIVSSEPCQYGYFGYKVSMDAAGEVIAVGADGEEDYRGAVYVFRHSLSDGDWLPEKTLRLTKRTAEDNFGGSVHVAADGKTIIVGAPGVTVDGKNDAGSVYIFDCFGRDWVLQKTIVREDAVGGSYFGWSVISSSNAHRFITSSPYEKDEQGSISIGNYLRSPKRNPSADSLAADDIISINHEEL